MRDAVVILAKEVAGHPPVLALDFEILHGYLFPALQGPHSRVPPSLVTYVIQEFPHRFVLPPGAITELLRTLQRYHHIKERIASFIQRTPDSLEPADNIELLELAAEIDRVSRAHSRDVPAPWTTDAAVSGHLLPRLTSFLADVGIGYRRLAWLQQARLRPLAEIFPRIIDVLNFPETQGLIAELNGRIVAYSPSRRSSESNACDAINVATVIAAQSFIDSDDVQQVVPPSLQLLTATRPLLELSLVDLGSDTLAKRLVQQRTLTTEHVRSHSERPPWVITTLSAAAVYCAFRQAYGSPAKALKQARQQFSSSFGLSAALVDYEQTLQESGEPFDLRTVPASLRRALDDVFQRGSIGKWYFPIRSSLQHAAHERLTQQELRRLESAELILEPSPADIVSVPVHLNSWFTSVELDDSSSSQFASLGVSVIEKTLTDFDRTRELLICSDWTGEVLLRAQLAPATEILSVCWAVALDLSTLATELTSWLTGPLEGVKGHISTSYEITGAESPSSRDVMQGQPTDNLLNVTVTSLPSATPITPARLVLPGDLAGTRRLFVLPVTVSIETVLGDVHIKSAFAADRHGPLGICNLFSYRQAAPLLHTVVLATHSWKGVPEFLDFCIAQLAAFATNGGIAAESHASEDQGYAVQREG